MAQSNLGNLNELFAENIGKASWTFMFGTCFAFISELSNQDRKEYFNDIKSKYSTVFPQLDEKMFCTNCQSQFCNTDSLGCKQCKTHVGKLEKKGATLLWSCCKTLHSSQKAKSKKENDHFATGCTVSDHWDNRALTDINRGLIVGYNKQSTLKIPFLVLVTLIYKKIITRAPVDDLINILRSISNMQYDNKKQRERPHFSRSNIGSRDYVTEEQRSYDSFFHTSLDNDEESNVPPDSLDTTKAANKKTQEYLDMLYLPDGTAALEKMIQNQTLMIDGSLFSEFLFDHLIIQNKKQELVFDPPENLFLVDLLTLEVTLNRVQQ